MGIEYKADNKVTDIKGRAKEAAGAATNDEDLKNEGRADQAEAAVKDGVEKVKDAGGKLKDALGDAKDAVTK